jgi:hypothetical protein
MPAEAGIQRQAPRKKRGKDWIPAFAGMTAEGSPVDFKSTCWEPTTLQAVAIQIILARRIRESKDWLLLA